VKSVTYPWGVLVADAVTTELDRQVGVLLAKGYAEAAGMTRAEFTALVAPLREQVVDVPFVLVVTRDVVPPARTIGMVSREGRDGFSVIDADDLARFAPIDSLTLPGRAYLLLDVDTGRDTLNVTPDDALTTIEAAGRSPLTIDEGIALVTQHPEAVAKNGGFSLLGSRCGDRRVTALWISQKRPKLGWCWAGNPHTWLGSASCAGRLGRP
jgi:hypothetical protein